MCGAQVVMGMSQHACISKQPDATLTFVCYQRMFDHILHWCVNMHAYGTDMYMLLGATGEGLLVCLFSFCMSEPKKVLSTPQEQ